jgi:hypothetical protein
MTADALKEQIALVIKQNGNQEITGYLLQQELFRIVDAAYGYTDDEIDAALDASAELTLEPVLAQQNAPGTQSLGFRYLVATAPTGAWVGRANEIAEWDGVGWVYTTPVLGNTVYVASALITRRWSGTAWVTASSTAVLSNGQNGVASGLKFGTNNNTPVILRSNNVDRLRLGTNGTLGYEADTSAGYTGLSVPHVSWVQDYVTANGGLGAGQGLTENAGNIDLGGSIDQYATLNLNPMNGEFGVLAEDGGTFMSAYFGSLGSPYQGYVSLITGNESASRGQLQLNPESVELKCNNQTEGIFTYLQFGPDRGELLTTDNIGRESVVLTAPNVTAISYSGSENYSSMVLSNTGLAARGKTIGLQTDMISISTFDYGSEEALFIANYSQDLSERTFFNMYASGLNLGYIDQVTQLDTQINVDGPDISISAQGRLDFRGNRLAFFGNDLFLGAAPIGSASNALLVYTQDGNYAIPLISVP